MKRVEKYKNKPNSEDMTEVKIEEENSNEKGL